MSPPKPPKHPEVAAFVAECMKRLGVTKARYLARAIGLYGVDDERVVRRWIIGETTPSFKNTLRLMRAAGLITEEIDLSLLDGEEDVFD